MKTPKNKTTCGEASPISSCSAPYLAAIETYQAMSYQEEYEIFIKRASILIFELMLGAMDTQEECEKFLRANAPKMLMTPDEIKLKK